MPKDKESHSVKLNRFANEFGNDIFHTNGQVLYCQACQERVNANKRFQVTQHVETETQKQFN